MSGRLLSRAQQSSTLLTIIHPSPGRAPSALLSQPDTFNTKPFKRQYHPSSPYLSPNPATQPSKNSQQSKKYTQNEPIKGAPFSELGATKTVKVVVIIALSIIGTLETIAYGKWFYSWWYREKDMIEDEEGKGSVDEWWERSGK